MVRTNGNHLLATRLDSLALYRAHYILDYVLHNSVNFRVIKGVGHRDWFDYLIDKGLRQVDKSPQVHQKFVDEF
jgi:hypothetical protein